MPESSPLSISQESLPGSQVAMTIEVPTEDVDAAYERVLSRLSQKLKIQGFRPGKAPRNVVEARVGPRALREEVIETLVPQVVSRAMAEKDVEAIDQPRVDIVEFERGRPARLTATVSVMPEVQLADLESIHVERTTTEVTDEMVDQRIAELLDGQAAIEPVDREVRDGDIVVADLDVSTAGQAVPSASRRAMEIEVREGVLIPELLAVVPGKKVDDVVHAQVQMPADTAEAELANKLADLTLTIRGVKEKRTPPLTDHIAGTLSNGEHATALELKIGVRRDLEEQARRFDALAHEQKVLQAVVEASEVEVPAPLVDHEVAHQLEEMEKRLQAQGLRLDRYFSYSGTTAQEWAAQARPDAESRLKVDIVLGEATKRLGVNPTTDEVMAYLASEAARDEQLKDQVGELAQNRSAVDYFRHRLTRLRTLERLVAIAAGEEPAPPAEPQKGSSAEIGEA